jgi:hypothetical protein
MTASPTPLTQNQGKMSTSQRQKEPVLLFCVTDVFEISGRGSILVPGIPHSFSPPVWRGAPLLLRRPDGTTIVTALGDLPMINATATRQSTAILLPGDIKKSDIPIGTEVWLSTSIAQ